MLAAGALDALRQFPQGTRFGCELAYAPFGGAGVAREPSLDRATLRQHVDDVAALVGDGDLRVSENGLFGGDRGLVLAGEGEGSGAAALLGLVGRGERAGDDAGADGAGLNATLCKGRGDDGGFERATGADLRAGLGGDVILHDDQPFAGGSGSGFGFFAAAGGFDEARVERADLALGGVGLRAQPFGALRFGAAIAIGLSSRAGLGVCRPYEERERCRKRG